MIRIAEHFCAPSGEQMALFPPSACEADGQNFQVFPQLRHRKAYRRVRSPLRRRCPLFREQQQICPARVWNSSHLNSWPPLLRGLPFRRVSCKMLSPRPWPRLRGRFSSRIVLTSVSNSRALAKGTSRRMYSSFTSWLRYRLMLSSSSFRSFAGTKTGIN
jgi:hypothetical protein